MWSKIREYYSPFLDVLTFSIMLGMIGYCLFQFNKLPDEIPIHFNSAGEADGFGNKGSLFGLMLIHFHTVVLCFVLNYFLIIRTENTVDSLQMVNIPFVKKEELNEEQIRILKVYTARMLAFLNLLMSMMFGTIYFEIIQQASGMQKGLENSFILMLILIFVPMIYYTWKIYRYVKSGSV